MTTTSLARMERSTGFAGDDVTSLIEGFWKTIDTVLVGRVTYEAAEEMDLFAC